VSSACWAAGPNSICCSAAGPHTPVVCRPYHLRRAARIFGGDAGHVAQHLTTKQLCCRRRRCRRCCCCCSDELGQPGSWRPNPSTWKDCRRNSFGSFDSLEGFSTSFADKRRLHARLYDGRSLIGQIAPGLRLCLAAEVATGLMCDR
jgi:hypothetical protein